MFQFSSESSASNSLQTDVYYDAQVLYSTTVLRSPAQHNSAVTGDFSDYNYWETSDTSDYSSAATLPSHELVPPNTLEADF